MLKIKIPFGFKTLQFDNVFTFYTGKIRVKCDMQELMSRFRDSSHHFMFTKGKRNCTTISYMTTDYNIHVNNMNIINAILCDIMHERIDAKYKVYTYNTYNEDVTL